MEILRAYDNQTLELISSNTDFTFSESDLQNGEIKLSIFSEVGSFLDSTALDSGLNDFYVKESSLFLKPNEYLDRSQISEGNYNLQYDFLKILNTNGFFISQISPSRKEIRITLREDENILSISNDKQTEITNFLNENQNSYNFNSFLELSQGRLTPINGYAFDNVTNNRRSLILKLNEILPNDISTYQTNFRIVNKFLASQTETVFFIDREGLAVGGLGLTIDEGYSTEPTSVEDSYGNYNDISGSVTENLISEITRKQRDLNLNIDYKKFDNHVHFGSAKSKLQKFRNKAEDLEGLYTQISASLSFTSSLKVIEKRKDLFKEVRKIQKQFTHYEHFMYNDGQSYSTSSAPGVGSNLAGNDYSNNVDNSFTKLDAGFDGFDRVYRKSENGFIHMFTDVYNVENPPFYNSNDFFYLSFILRGGGGLSEFKLNISGGLANQNYNTAGGTTLGNYGYNNHQQIPFNAWSGSALLNPQSTGSQYRRYIFRAQQNYFRPNSDNKIIDHDFTYVEDSSFWEILSGSNVISASTSGSFGDDYAYGILDQTGVFTSNFFPSQYGEDGTLSENQVTASILPQGDLFPIFTQAAGDKEAIFTDVVVTKNNPTNIHPFSRIYRPPSGSFAGSSEWNDWYNTMESIAENYDNDNIYSLVNNLPSFLKSGDEHQTLRDFVNMLGEQFDLLRSYIDNYHNIYRLGYKNPNSMPDDLLPIIGDSLGFNLKNPLTGSLENYLEGTKGDEVGDKKAISALWTKILNNLIYIYKTKGTQESLNTLLNLYGYETNAFGLTEYGGSTEEHNPSVVTNNAVNDLDNGLENTTGNVSFLERTDTLRSLNLSSGSDYLALDWWRNDANPNGIEFIFRSNNTTNTQTLLRSSGSGGRFDRWDLRVIPSGSSTTTGSLEFRLNYLKNASSALTTNHISMSTDYISGINDFKYFNVLLQRNVVTGSNSIVSSDFTQSYHMFIGRKDGDKIKDIQFISMSSHGSTTGKTRSTGSFANSNFVSASGITGGNLLFGESITGSMAQIRAWDSYISMSKFKQHILNYNSIVAGTATSARDSLIYHFILNEDKNATTITDFSSTNKVKSFNKTVSSQPSLTIKNSVSTVKNFSFQVRGTDAIKSDRQFNIGANLNVIGNLNSETPSLAQPYNPKENRQITNKIGKTFSYVDAIDSIVINAMSDFVLDDYLDDGSNDGVYTDLLNLRKQLITERNVAVDVVNNLSTAESRVDDPEIIGVLDSLTPAKTKLEFAYEVKNDTLFRSKIRQARLQTSLNPNFKTGSTNLVEPSLSVLFNENKFNKSINVPGDEFSISSFANENLKEKNIDILTDEVTISALSNENVKTNHSTPLDVVDLTDSKTQTIFEIEPDLSSLLLGSHNEFFKNHGKSSNQTFFKSGKQGNNGDYNTYKYESRFFFRTIGDVERFYPVSGTYEDRTGTNAKQPFNHHTNFRHFGNRYYVDSGSFTYTSHFGALNKVEDGRMVGRTLFFTTDSDGAIVYPINHFFKVGTSKDGLTNLIYKGTQNDGSTPPQFDPQLDLRPSSSAYTINVGGADTTKKLKVIR